LLNIIHGKRQISLHLRVGALRHRLAFCANRSMLSSSGRSEIRMRAPESPGNGAAAIGEFSFILAGLGVGLNILPAEGRDLILAGAILSIFANPFIFSLLVGRAIARKNLTASPSAQTDVVESNKNKNPHIVLIGFGRVGKLVAQALQDSGASFSIIESQADVIGDAPRGLNLLEGDASSSAVLKQAGIHRARQLVIAIPAGFEAGSITQTARELNPSIEIMARAHSDEEVQYLRKVGAKHVIMGEREIATRMTVLLTS
jgi:monovalent cation:H+ antiporter-2, CPA2 family